MTETVRLLESIAAHNGIDPGLLVDTLADNKNIIRELISLKGDRKAFSNCLQEFIEANF
jgi:hypothetical protein